MYKSRNQTKRCYWLVSAAADSLTNQSECQVSFFHWPITIDTESRMNQSECQVGWLHFPALWHEDVFVAVLRKSYKCFECTGPLINQEGDTNNLFNRQLYSTFIYPYSSSPCFYLSKINSFLYFLQQESKPELNLFSRIR